MISHRKRIGRDIKCTGDSWSGDEEHCVTLNAEVSNTHENVPSVYVPAFTSCSQALDEELLFLTTRFWSY